MTGVLIRYLWAAPNSLIGLVLACLARLSGGGWRNQHGVLEVHGPFAAWVLQKAMFLSGGVAAMAVGHVVIGCDDACLERCREHERVHVKQYERWGPLFLPVYALASLWAWARGGHYYRDNFLEREAFRVAPPGQERR